MLQIELGAEPEDTMGIYSVGRRELRMDGMVICLAEKGKNVNEVVSGVLSVESARRLRDYLNAIIQSE